MSNLTTFEYLQLLNMTAQSFLLLATFLGALYVGVKQFQINRQLLELQNQPSIEIGTKDGSLQILNKGHSSIWLWGTQIEDADKAIEAQPRLITPQGFYYLMLDKFMEKALARLGENGQENVTFKLFIKTADGRKYVVRNILLCVVKANKLSVHSQTVGVDHEKWSSK